MTNTKQKLEQEGGEDNNKPFDYIHLEKYRKQQENYSKAIIRDTYYENVQTGEIKKRKPYSWPYQKDVNENRYENWITNCINPENNEPYGPKDDYGNAIKVDKKISYKIKNIFRVRTNTGEEFIKTTGTLEGYDISGSIVTCPLHLPELATITHFGFSRNWNEEKKQFISSCNGPIATEDRYLLACSPENLEYVYRNFGAGVNKNTWQDPRNKFVSNNLVNFYVEDERSGKVLVVNYSDNIETNFQVFKEASFEYLYNLPELKREEKKEAARVVTEEWKDQLHKQQQQQDQNKNNNNKSNTNVYK